MGSRRRISRGHRFECIFPPLSHFNRVIVISFLSVRHGERLRCTGSGCGDVFWRGLSEGETRPKFDIGAWKSDEKGRGTSTLCAKKSLGRRGRCLPVETRKLACLTSFLGRRADLVAFNDYQHFSLEKVTSLSHYSVYISIL